MKQVQIKIAPDGSITIDTKGFTGADCEKATRAIETALGEKTSDKKKPDWFQSAQATDTQTA